MVKGQTTYRPAETRRRILEAAFAEMWRVGFRAASLEAILLEAGVTKGALYHHFRSKDAAAIVCDRGDRYLSTGVFTA